MKTEVLKISDLSQDYAVVERAAKILQDGGLVALPTETVYGIAANALDSGAVAGIFKAKGRPSDNPLIVHISCLAEAFPLVTDFPPSAQHLAESFWPGPLTIILPKTEKFPEIVSANLDTVALRMPSNPIACAIIKASGLPLAAPSANISGRPSPTSARHCIEDLDGKVDLIIDGGDCDVGLESTVITLATTPPRLLRPGIITLEQLREVLGEVDADAAVSKKIENDAVAASPGMKYKHYAPAAKITLVHGDFEAFAKFAEEITDATLLVFDGEENNFALPCVTYGAENEPAEQAHKLFASLRRLDEIGAKRVFARAPQKQGAGLAVYNRLIRAAAFDEIFL